MSLPEPDARIFIYNAIDELIITSSTDKAIKIIGAALERYTIFDLQYIGGSIYKQLAGLPSKYKSEYIRYSPYFLEQYHAFMQMYHQQTPTIDKCIKDPISWQKYWDLTRTLCFVTPQKPNDTYPPMDTPTKRFFFRLVYGYIMFISGETAHSIGMPFPGGARIYKSGDRVLCPIRNKEKDYPFALCNFCPAEQDPDYI
ncbi:MAG TPA: DUF2115 family protein [Methanocorpusculum sp.]|nr:DUF2115 family protein [Methanocorpusculum sp.]